MPDSNLDDYVLSQHREPHERGPPPDRAAPTFNDIAKKKKKCVETAARRLIREKIEARKRMPVTVERLKAGNIAFPVLLDLPKSEDPEVAHEEEEEAYGIWCCEVNMYCRGEDLYDDWSSGRITLQELEKSAFPGPPYIYSKYNPFVDPPDPLDFTTDHPKYPATPQAAKRKFEGGSEPDGKSRRLRLLQNPSTLLANLPKSNTGSSSSNSKSSPKSNPKSNPKPSPKSHPKPTAKATNPQQRSSHSKPTSAGSNGGQGSKNPESASTSKATRATQSQYGGRAIAVDGERGNMYPGITRGSGPSQSVQSCFAQSVKAQQSKFAPKNPSPLRNIAYSARQGVSAAAHDAGFSRLERTDEETIWNGKLVCGQRVPPGTRVSISQLSPSTSKNPPKASGQTSASQPSSGGSRDSRASGAQPAHPPSTPRAAKMPPVRPAPPKKNAPSKNAGSSRRSIREPVDDGWYGGRGAVDHPMAQAGIQNTSIQSSDRIQIQNNSISHATAQASVLGSDRGSQGNGSLSPRAKKRLRQKRNKQSAARQAEQQRVLPQRWAHAPPHPPSEDEELDEDAPELEDIPEREQDEPQARGNSPERATDVPGVFTVYDRDMQTLYNILRPDVTKYPAYNSGDTGKVNHYPDIIQNFLGTMGQHAKVPPKVCSHHTHTCRVLLPVVEIVFGFCRFVENQEQIARNKQLFEQWGDLRFIYKRPERYGRPFQHEFFVKAVCHTLYANASCFGRRYPNLFVPISEHYICFIAVLANHVISRFSTGVYKPYPLNEEVQTKDFAEIMDIVEYMRKKQATTLWNVQSKITDYGIRYAERSSNHTTHVPAAERRWSPDAVEVFQSRFDNRFAQDHMNPMRPKVDRASPKDEDEDEVEQEERSDGENSDIFDITEEELDRDMERFDLRQAEEDQLEEESDVE
ncbi:hypothetical protein FRC11_010585 [Ceratobasidium sp. 423]|nr:hypothetical protein FRC11_010585 [Ceratobasidium sp. 423]